MVDLRFHAYAGPKTVAQLCEGSAIKASCEGGANVLINGASEIETARSGDIVLAATKNYAANLTSCMASAVVTSASLLAYVPGHIHAIVTDSPQMLFTAFLEILFPKSSEHLARQALQSGAKPLVEEGALIGPGVVLGPNVEIGAGTIIGPNSVISAGVTIGRKAIIGANVSVECAHIGDNVILHSGVRIGTQGFGWLDHGKSNMKIPQLGRVIIQDRVEVGANSTIDRGALGDTTIGESTKIDNLVQIGHNCRIGRNCLIAAATGLSGSTIVGDGVLMGGGVGTSGHLTIGDGSVIHGRAAVTKDWPAGSMLAGAPAQDIKSFWRELALLRRLGRGEKK